MDFFDRQERAKRTTTQLLVVFLFCVLAVMVSVCAVVAVIVTWQTGKPWDPAMVAGWFIFTGVLIGGGSLWKQLELRRKGGAGVAEDLGGEPVNPATQDPAERRLLNVVEEMALASSARVPQVFVLREDDSINAFAAGMTQDQAAIGVTRGCLSKLRRDELQGVIAHEFSHVVQGDMALNMRLIGWLHGILMLSLAGYGAVRAGGEVVRAAGRTRSKGQANIVGVGLGIMIVGAVLWAIGSLGIFFGRLLQAAVSRQREYLADAAAVQFTRNPEGLAGALKKLLRGGSGVKSPHASEAGHLFFGSVMPFSLAGLLATHPPLERRIQLLDPAWVPGSEPKEEVLPDEPWDVDGIMAGLASPSAVPKKAQSQGVIGEIPPSLVEAAHELAPAAALALGILFDAAPSVQAVQWRAIEAVVDPRILSELRAWLPSVLALPAKAKLPLLDLTIPTLRGMAREQFKSFRNATQSLIAADGAISLAEFAMHFVLRHQLDSHFYGAPALAVRHRSAASLSPSWSLVAAALAWRGAQGDVTKAGEAFAAGYRVLNPNAKPPDLPQVGWNDMGALELALEDLQTATEPLRNVVAASLWSVADHDRVIEEDEACLLRAVMEALGADVTRTLKKTR